MTADSAGDSPVDPSADRVDEQATEPAEAPGDRGSKAATFGFVLAGVALAAAFLDWTPAVAMYGIPGFPGAVAAVIALGVLGLRRHGVLDHRAAIVAVLGFVGVVVSGAIALLLPGITGDPATTAGIGVYLALLVGVVGIGVAYADYVALPDRVFLARVRAGLVAASLGVGGLLFAYLLTFVVLGLFASLLPQTAQNATATVVFSLGLGVVAAAYAHTRPEGFDYLDVAMPDRRGWFYVAGGIVGMFAVLIAGAVISTWLGLPSTQHGLIEQAQRNPVILLPLVPLSLLAIGPGEELLNRNVVQKHLYGTYTRYGAVLVATLVFTLIHVPAYGAGATPAALLVTLVRLFLVSLVLGVVYERTDNIVVAALVHGGFDAIQFGAAYVLITQGMM